MEIRHADPIGVPRSINGRNKKFLMDRCAIQRAKSHFVACPEAGFRPASRNPKVGR
ncbi:hypothetical protein BRPE64_CCDS04750 [Caballeronia insecticola]|uniref:Uncharacterized protein n=1 Tax=Caballeronia insecticola TaxID=758793 RepID=R4WPF1_9BURK|nr:hypothetical protein BRPE64_CCDS04750 [Caballeronia insecticola]